MKVRNRPKAGSQSDPAANAQASAPLQPPGSSTSASKPKLAFSLSGKKGCYVTAFCHKAHLQSERQHSRPSALVHVARQTCQRSAEPPSGLRDLDRFVKLDDGLKHAPNDTARHIQRVVERRQATSPDSCGHPAMPYQCTPLRAGKEMRLIKCRRNGILMPSQMNLL